RIADIQELVKVLVDGQLFVVERDPHRDRLFPNAVPASDRYGLHLIRRRESRSEFDQRGTTIELEGDVAETRNAAIRRTEVQMRLPLIGGFSIRIACAQVDDVTASAGPRQQKIDVVLILLRDVRQRLLSGLRA